MSLQAWLQQIEANVQIVAAPEPVAPVCDTCGGTGYSRYDVEIGDPRFGKLYPCENPNCPVAAGYKAGNARRFMEARSTWKPGYDDMTFESFRKLMGGANNPRWRGKRAPYAIALAFARIHEPFDQNTASLLAFKRDWPEAKPGKSRCVVLSDTVGTGKTGLAISAANDLMAQGKSVIFTRLKAMIEHIQETYQQDWEGESTTARKDVFINCPYLIIDEFEVQNYTKDRLELIEEIIRGRADRPDPLPFFLTTNLTQEELYRDDYWGKRIADVVSKAHIVPCGGVKLRQTMSLANGDW